MKTIIVMVTLLCLPAGATADLILTEVFYDHTSTDDGWEWVEILNTGDLPVDLTGYIIAYGGTDYGYGYATLAGVVESCETFVIGGPSADAENGNPVFDQVFNFDPDIQNSGTTADGVALFAPGADVLVDCPLDAVIYGTENTNGLLNADCVAGPPDVGDASQDSLERMSQEGNWLIQPDPQPNGVTFNCGDVHTEDHGSWGCIKGWYR